MKECVSKIKKSGYKRDEEKVSTLTAETHLNGVIGKEKIINKSEKSMDMYEEDCMDGRKDYTYGIDEGRGQRVS